MEQTTTKAPSFPDMPQQLPNATAVLVLGIISIVGCFCYGLVGIVCGIIALIMAKKARALYAASPATYTEASYKNMNAGRVCAIIGTILSALYFILVVVLIFTIGFAGLMSQDFLKTLQQVQ